MATEKLVNKERLTYYHTKATAKYDGKYVAKEDGKGLSTNDYTTAEKSKLAAIAEGAEVNAIATVKVNGSALTPDANKAVDVTVPTKTSDLTNDSDFQTGTQVSTAITTAIAGVTQFDYQVVESLPATGVKGTIYLMANSGSGSNVYDEYVWIDNKFEKLGSTEVDLSGYYTKTEVDTLLNAKADASTTYTKTEVDSLVNAKADAFDIITEAEIDAIVA